MVKTLQELRAHRAREDDTPDGPAAAVPGPMASLPMLICSDLHVGEYVKDHARIDYVKRARNLDRDFCQFLEHFARHRLRKDLPWRLVINGDFIDFVAVTFVPSARELQDNPDFAFSDEERRLGLDNSEAKCVWKLDHIAKRHRPLFVYLADFVGQGNHLDLLYGNHDVEVYWPGVQTRFVELLVETYFGGEQVDGVTEEEFQARVRFHEWFLHVPGRLHLEHGNQYDDFSSFERRLRPVMPQDEQQIAMPISHQVIRHFVNRYHGFRSHDKDAWTITDYVTWLRGQGMSNLIRIGFLYGSLFSRVWSYARIVQRTRESAESIAHYEELLDEQATTYGLDARTVRLLNEHRARPIEARAITTLQVSALDKYLLMMGVASGMLSALTLGVLVDVFSGFDPTVTFGNGTRLLAVLALFAVGAVLWPLTGRIMGALAGGVFSTSVSPKLEVAAGRAAAFLGVKHVVFGHSHVPLQRKLQHNPERFYTNTGSFLAIERRERHDPHCRSPLTFAVYNWETQALDLYRWCTWEGEPVEFRAHVLSEEHDAEKVRPLGVKHDDLVEALESADHEVVPTLFRR